MCQQERDRLKAEFKHKLSEFVDPLKGHISTPDEH
jgi:hypothetical protein